MALTDHQPAFQCVDFTLPLKLYSDWLPCYASSMRASLHVPPLLPISDRRCIHKQPTGEASIHILRRNNHSKAQLILHHPRDFARMSTHTNSQHWRETLPHISLPYSTFFAQNSPSHPESRLPHTVLTRQCLRTQKCQAKVCHTTSCHTMAGQRPYLHRVTYKCTPDSN
jgi:hypothetical protein